MQLLGNFGRFWKEKLDFAGEDLSEPLLDKQLLLPNNFIITHHQPDSNRE